MLANIADMANFLLSTKTKLTLSVGWHGARRVPLCVSLQNWNLHLIFSIPPLLYGIKRETSGGTDSTRQWFPSTDRAQTWQSCVCSEWCIVGGRHKVPRSVCCTKASSLSGQGNTLVDPDESDLYLLTSHHGVQSLPGVLCEKYVCCTIRYVLHLINIRVPYK